MLDGRDPQFFTILDENARLVKLADGFGFTEGPIWHPEENWLLFSDIAKSRQFRWSERDGLTVFRCPSNQSNGNAFDHEGRIISCEHASSHLVRHEHGGKLVKSIATHYQGRELNSPNDVVVDSQKRIWFTDPSFGRIREDLGILRKQELGFQGVFRLDPDGELTLMADNFQQPNGLCFSNNQKKLYINDSWGWTIHVFDVSAEGNISGGKIWSEVTGEGEGVPDGMKIDLAGNIFCNGPGGVHVFAPDATCLGVIKIPEKSTNFCFGGEKRSTLFITASNSIYRIETKTASAPMIPAL